jgi:hypothetical protein
MNNWVSGQRTTEELFPPEIIDKKRDFKEVGFWFLLISVWHVPGTRQR